MPTPYKKKPYITDERSLCCQCGAAGILFFTGASSQGLSCGHQALESKARALESLSRIASGVSGLRAGFRV